MTKLGYITFSIILILLFIGSYSTYRYFKKDTPQKEFPLEIKLPQKSNDRVEKLMIQSGETFSFAVERGNVDSAVAEDIVSAADGIYNLANIRAGNKISLVYDITTNELKKIIYEISSEEELVITPIEEKEWNVERIPITYTITQEHIRGSIETSLYDAAKKLGADDAIIIELATVYQWTIDFGIDTQVGDTFNFIYEKRYRDGVYSDTGRVLAADYTTRDITFKAYFFNEAENNIGYFDENGTSLKKEFLKAPVEFRYISSGFTTGKRYVEAFNVSTGHRAIDYAAPYGTPVRAVGAGTVITAGWNGSYGNFVSIHHNDTYTTNYAHLSSIQVSRGQKVAQSDIIGNIGSTGFSTGPHLHYEMEKFGTKINPLREEFPPGDAIREENLDRFQRVVSSFDSQL